MENTDIANWLTGQRITRILVRGYCDASNQNKTLQFHPLWDNVYFETISNIYCATHLPIGAVSLAPVSDIDFAFEKADDDDFYAWTDIIRILSAIADEPTTVQNVIIYRSAIHIGLVVAVELELEHGSIFIDALGIDGLHLGGRGLRELWRSYHAGRFLPVG